MGKIKETQNEVFQGQVVTNPNGDSGFTQPTFSGLLEIIRGFQYQNSLDESEEVCESQLRFSEYTEDVARAI